MAVAIATVVVHAAPCAADEPEARPSLETRVQKLEQDAKKAEETRRPIVVSGFAHVDWTVFRQSSQDEVSQETEGQPAEPLNENRFLIRRGRLRGEADRGLVHGAVEIEANTIRGPQVRPVNVEASLKWPASRPYPGPTVDPRTLSDHEPWFIVTAGLFRTPFGFEVPEPENSRPWLERSTMSNALFPQSFDLGLRVLGGYKMARYALGIMNGDPIGERAFPGRDPNESKELIFRVGIASNVTEAVHVEAGLSGLSGRGFHRGRAATKDEIVWRDVNEDTVVTPDELQAVAGSPATPSQNFKRFAMGADVRASLQIPVLGTLGARAEIIRASNLDRGLFFADPVDQTYDLRELGWYVGVYQEITRWGLICVRYDRYDPDADAREREPFVLVPRDLSLSTWSFNATGRFFGFARLIAQYDLRRNAFGRDVNGAPTTLDDDSFTIRAEARF
jgi:hypothetical protein